MEKVVVWLIAEDGKIGMTIEEVDTTFHDGCGWGAGDGSGDGS